MPLIQPFPFDPNTISSKRAPLVVVMSLLTLLVMIVDLYSEITRGYVLHAVLESITVIAIIVNLLIFLRRANLATASMVLVSLISFMAIASLQVDGFGKESGLFWTAALPLPIFILVGVRRGVWLSAVNLAAIAVIFANALFLWIPPLFSADLLGQMVLGYIAISVLIYFFEKIRSDYEKRLQALVKEREALLQEVNHRVKNNMQIIISMLRLQADRHDTQVKEIVKIAENRIRSMLSIHELLYKSETLSQIDAGAYIRKLLIELARSFSFDYANIRTQIDAQTIDVDYLVQIGFIVNELVTNAIKHARNPQGLHIDITLTQDASHITLTVKDNGLPPPPSDTPPRAQGLGTMFVHTIVTQQLHGSIETSHEAGHCVRIGFEMMSSK